MLEQYQTEILALVALLVVVLIYIMIKKRSSKTDDSKEVEDSSEELVEIEIEEEKDIVDEYDKATLQNSIEEEKEEEIQEPKDEFSGSEEGTFEEPPMQRKADNTPVIEPTHKIKKRTVPPHDKITKDNFKEFKVL